MSGDGAVGRHPGWRRLMAGYDAFVFDYDGTLVDSEGINEQAVQAALSSGGVHVGRQWVVAEPFRSVSRLRERLHEELGVTLVLSDEEFVAAAFDHCLAHSHELRQVAGIAAAVDEAVRRGPVAVATSHDSRVARAGLRTVGFDRYFPVVVGRDQVRDTKPSPEVFLVAARLLAVPPERCLAIENTDRGVTAATAAGMAVADLRRWPAS